MPSLTIDQVADLITTTQRNLGKGHWTEIATRLTHYEAMTNLLKKGKVKESTGTGIRRNIMLDHSGSARNVGLYATDTVNVQDVMATFEVPFRHTTANWAYDEREETINDGPEQIVDLVQVRRTDMRISIAERMEADFWTKPADSNDVTTPWGVRMFLVSNSSEGFNGGNPSGFTAGYAGIDSSTYTRWKNYTGGTYTAISKTDAIARMRKAARYTDFKSPVDIPDYRNNTGQRFKIYCNQTSLDAFETVGEASNENLGRDLMPMDGGITFRKNPIIYIPALDADTTDPILMMDWADIHIYVLKGWHLRDSDPMRSATQHTVLVNFCDLTYAIVCTNRRRQAILTK